MTPAQRIAITHDLRNGLSIAAIVRRYCKVKSADVIKLADSLRIRTIAPAARKLPLTDDEFHRLMASTTPGADWKKHHDARKAREAELAAIARNRNITAVEKARRRAIVFAVYGDPNDG